jgi:hypothetical protein
VARAVDTDMSQTRERSRPSLAALLTHAGPLFKVKLAFLLASFVSFVLSVSLWFTDHELQGIFVGIWVPSILSLGALLLASNRGDVR